MNEWPKYAIPYFLLQSADTILLMIKFVEYLIQFN